MLKLDLRSLILLLSICATLIAVSLLYHAGHQVQRDLLIQQTLESNRNYAIKLADITDGFLDSAHMQLRFSAGVIAGQFDDYDVLRNEVIRLKEQSASFSLAVVVDAEGRILINAPLNPKTVGTVIDSVGARQALTQRRPLISEPYMSVSNRLVVSISEPLHDEAGNYLGYIAGLIHLHEKNILNDLLGEHAYRDGSYLYVVSRDRRLIYHKEPGRLGEQVKGNRVIEAVLGGAMASGPITNSKGVEMLAGYAPIAEAGWGVVAQRPLAATLEDLDALMMKILSNSAPFMLLLILAVWGIARIISEPLWKLALAVRQNNAQLAVQEIAKVRSWYFEAAQLKRAILEGLNALSQRIGKLNTQSVTDTLTGLLNRRGVQSTQQQWTAARRPFAVVSIDIDHFKQVNDTYGHDVGDLTLQFLAEQMRQVSRGNDVLCRNGGEEFSMLLPDISPENALPVAERLRERMAIIPSPTGQPVTISIGIAHFPQTAGDLKSLLKAADQALYSAKHNGRNRVVLAEPGA